MQDVLTLAREAGDIASFAKAYFKRLGEILDSLDPVALNTLAERLEEARLNDRTIFVAGNGGSATTATSMANDLGFDILKKAGVERTFRIHALTDNNAAVTAIANDVGYDRVFVDQMRVHYRDGDPLIVISASGNSPNVVKAAEWVQERGGAVLALVGFEGGRLAEMAEVVLHFASKKGEYGPVEDAHLALNHVLAHWFQEKLKVDPHP
jgi:D-sedoheptulose 7-phosphate isomerase